MNLKSRLVKTLEALSAVLEKSGKKDTAKFFHTTSESVESDCNGDQRELLELLKRLKSSGAITQYANFSALEEQLWDEVYNSASEYVKQLEQLP